MTRKGKLALIIPLTSPGCCTTDNKDVPQACHIQDSPFSPQGIPAPTSTRGRTRTGTAQKTFAQRIPTSVPTILGRDTQKINNVGGRHCCATADALHTPTERATFASGLSPAAPEKGGACECCCACGMSGPSPSPMFEHGPGSKGAQPRISSLKRLSTPSLGRMPRTQLPRRAMSGGTWRAARRRVTRHATRQAQELAEANKHVVMILVCPGTETEPACEGSHFAASLRWGCRTLLSEGQVVPPVPLSCVASAALCVHNGLGPWSCQSELPRTAPQ
jgi:hypothetical protein